VSTVAQWALAAGLLGALYSSAALLLGVPARFLVWGSVGHFSLVIVSLALGIHTGAGLEAAFLLLVGLLLGNTLAWLGWKALRGAAKSADLAPARGQGRRIPLAGVAFVFGALASAGAPGSPGFFGRVMLFLAAAKVGGAAAWLAAAMCAVHSLVWVFACATAARVAFLEPRGARSVRQPEAGYRVMALALAGAILLAGLAPGPLMAVARRIAKVASIPA